MFCKILVIYLSNQPPVTEGHVADAFLNTYRHYVRDRLPSQIYPRNLLWIL